MCCWLQSHSHWCHLNPWCWQCWGPPGWGYRCLGLGSVHHIAVTTIAAQMLTTRVGGSGALLGGLVSLRCITRGVSVIGVIRCVTLGVSVIGVVRCVTLGVSVIGVVRCVTRGVSVIGVVRCVTRGVSVIGVVRCVTRGVSVIGVVR